MVITYLAILALSLAHILYRWNTQTLKEGTIDYEDLDLEYPSNVNRKKHLLLVTSYFLVGFSVTGIVLYFMGGTIVSLIGAIVGGWILGCSFELGIAYLLKNY